MYDITILGAGTWGIALAQMLSGYCNVSVWSAIDSEIDQLDTLRVHPNLKDVVLADSIRFTKNLSGACKNKYIVVAVPSVFVRSTTERIAEYVSADNIIISVAKGLEAETCFTMAEVISDVLGKRCTNVAVLSGPTHAEEVVKGMPTTIVAASDDIGVAREVQRVFSNNTMRVYTNPDMRGVEICGTVKNIIALAAGVSAGLGYGDNARAALITRGCAEITRLGSALGCMRQTFSGLAGIGDLIVTATSSHSRNNRAGNYIGSGMTVDEAIKKVGMVVEGINALKPVVELAKKYSVDMPITFAINDIVYNNGSAEEISDKVFNRELRSEVEKYPLDISFDEYIRKSEGKFKSKRVITYGTFDLLHYGHINLLKRAKALGDYLVVVLSTDEFNWNMKQKKCYFSYEERKMLLEAVRYVDLVIPENNWEQKRTDVHEYHIDTFVMGDDWRGKFDFLKEEGVDVVYLPRTPEISTTQIKKDLNK